MQWVNPSNATEYVARANASLFQIAQQGMYDGFSLDYRTFTSGAPENFGDVMCDIIAALKRVRKLAFKLLDAYCVFAAGSQAAGSNRATSSQLVVSQLGSRRVTSRGNAGSGTDG